MRSGARNPRSRDKAAPFERFWLVVKEIDDVVRDFWWEARFRHRGSGQGERAISAGLTSLFNERKRRFVRVDLNRIFHIEWSL